VRKWSVVIVAVGVVACARGEQMPADLRADLADISSSGELAMASSQAGAPAVVSAQEQLAARTQAPAPSARAPRPRASTTPRTQAAPRPQPTPVREVDYAVAAPVPQPVPRPQPTENRGLDGMGEEAVITGRPQVVDASPGPVARGGGGGGGGADVGTILAGIGIAVIRGGVVVGDVHCPPPRRRTRNGAPMALPNQSPGGGITVGTTVRGIPIYR
jgi:hypothetical protein